MTWNLAIEPSLTGALHEFEFEGHHVKIVLPGEDSIGSAHEDGARLWCNCWLKVDGRDVPQSFNVRDIDMNVASNEFHSLPDQLLQLPLKQLELVGGSQRKFLDQRAQFLGTVADEAFHYWVSILAWHANASRLGRPERRNHKSGWTTYLVDPASRHRYWSAGHVIVVKKVITISSKVWGDAQRDLTEGKLVPVPVSMLFDAEEHAHNGDTRRAVVDCAIACETFLRDVLTSGLPEELPEAIQVFLGSANMHVLRSRLVVSFLTDEERKVLKGLEGPLERLFNSRNKLVHQWRLLDMTDADFAAHMYTTRTLIGMRHPEVLAFGELR